MRITDRPLNHFWYPLFVLKEQHLSLHRESRVSAAQETRPPSRQKVDTRYPESEKHQHGGLKQVVLLWRQILVLSW